MSRCVYGEVGVIRIRKDDGEGGGAVLCPSVSRCKYLIGGV